MTNDEVNEDKVVNEMLKDSTILNRIDASKMKGCVSRIVNDEINEDEGDVFMETLEPDEMIALMDRQSVGSGYPLFKIVNMIDNDPNKYNIKLVQLNTSEDSDRIYYGFLKESELWWTRNDVYLDIEHSVLREKGTNNIVHKFDLIHTVL